MAPTKNAPFAAASSAPPHFVIVPHAGQGHLIPMVDLARLLTTRGARVSFITTPLTAERLRGVADRAARDGLTLDIVALPFSAADAAGLPADCENTDRLTDNAQFLPFVNSMRALAAPFESFLRSTPMRPCCIVSDGSNPWAVEPARRLGIPRLFFHAVSCFYSLCDLNTTQHRLHEKLLAADEKTSHVIPGMPVRVEVTRDTCPGYLVEEGWVVLHNEAMEALRTADGMVINTFAELEPQFIAAFDKALGGDKPVWTIGPLFINNRDDAALSAAHRNNHHEVAIDAWLDGQAPRSVVYVNFGSLARKLPAQLFEVGHGLEDSGKPFLWVVKESEVTSPEVQDWMSAFESRTAGRGLVVRGWAPQLAILSHGAVGGFVTHCGWNALLEAIVNGVPMVTWPHFADQFLTEKLAVDVFGVGLSIGATRPVLILDDESVKVTRGDVARAVSELMGDSEEAEERRRKTGEYGEKARRAMEKGGSSYENLTRLIERFTRVEGKKNTKE
uniref:Glycosyltransferase n=1 Tax=Leersia perrieri TaxID=77586 RepID=A0A0D9VDJ8_9ORYZ